MKLLTQEIIIFIKVGFKLHDNPTFGTIFSIYKYKPYNYLIMRLFLISLITASFGLLSYIWAPLGSGAGENKFIVDGDGFEKANILLDIKSNDFKSNYFARTTYNYEEGYENVSIKICGAHLQRPETPYCGITIYFNKFNNVGKYNIDENTIMSIYMKTAIEKETYTTLYIPDENCVVDLIKYEEIGGLAEGTFSGTFAKMTWDPNAKIYVDADEIVTITNGYFSTVRYPDYHYNQPETLGSKPDNFDPKKKKKKK